MRILFFLPILALSLASCTMDTPDTQTPIIQDDTKMMMQTATVWAPSQVMQSGAMMQRDTKTDSRMKPNGYMDYRPDILSSALQSGQKVVLFFAASWCSTCKALDRVIQSDLASIGGDTIILRVNYDDSADLRRQYGVTVQHTTVILNSDGSEKSKKIWARTLAEVVGK